MALVLDSSDAIYGAGRYGSARYGIASPIYIVDGQRLTSAIGTVKVQVVEKSDSVRATLTLGTIAFVAKANKTLAATHLDIALGTSSIFADANLEAEAVTIVSGPSDPTLEAKANQQAASVRATFTLGAVSARSINTVPVNGVSLSTTSGSVKVNLRTFVSGARTSSAVGTVKVNLSKVVAFVRVTSATNTVTTGAKANTVLAFTRSSLTLGSIKKQLNTKPVGVRVTATSNTVSLNAKANKTVTHTRMTSNTTASTATGVTFNYPAFSANYSPQRTIYIPRAA